MFGLKKNQSDWERVGRVVLAVTLINLGIAMMGTWGLMLGVIGLVSLIFGISGWCPFCALFKRASEANPAVGAVQFK